MTSTPLTMLAVGGAVLTPTLFSEVRSRVIPAYVTAAHRAAMASLEAKIFGLAPRVHADTNPMLALHRANDLHRAMVPLRGAVGMYAKLTAAELDELCTRFLAACGAGVAHGYRVTTYAALGESVEAVNARVMAELVGGTRPKLAMQLGIGIGEVTLTSLGEAVLAAGQERNRVRLLGPFGNAVQDAAKTGIVVATLAIEMDNVGYLITGKPEEKTIAGGVGAAWDASVDFVSDVPGIVAEKVAIAGLSAAMTRVGLLAIAGFIVWKVATRGAA